MACGLILAFVFFLPRVLADSLGAESPWTSFIYMYALGGIFFMIGNWIAMSTGAVKWHRKSDRFWFLSVILGFGFFFSLHGFWIFYAINSPHY